VPAVKYNTPPTINGVTCQLKSGRGPKFSDFQRQTICSWFTLDASLIQRGILRAARIAAVVAPFAGRGGVLRFGFVRAGAEPGTTIGSAMFVKSFSTGLTVLNCCGRRAISGYLKACAPSTFPFFC
jgi:hypothetical protein